MAATIYEVQEYRKIVGKIDAYCGKRDEGIESRGIADENQREKCLEHCG